MKAETRTIGLLLGILLVIVVLAPVPGGASRFANTLHNAAHGPIFGVVALLILLGMRALQWPANASAPRQYALAVAAAVAAGLATEVAQALTNRDASWQDLRNDAIGALAFLLLYLPFDARIRSLPRRGMTATGLLVGVSLLTFLLAPVGHAVLEYRQRDRMFPTLADFTRGYDRYFIRQNHAEIGPIAMPARWAGFAGEQAMHVRLLQAVYPGIEIIEPMGDWARYSTFVLDLTNPRAAELVLQLRIHDAAHTNEFADRFNRRITLPGATRTLLRVPLEEVRRAPRGRQMQLDSIAGIVIFETPWSAGEFLLSRAWLE